MANMVAQHRVTVKGRPAEPPIRYAALAQCLEKLRPEAVARRASVHMPRICCGLAGGRWEEVEPLLVRHLAAAGVAVMVYDLPLN